MGPPDERRRTEPLRLERLSPFARLVIAVVVLAIVSALLQILFVRPYLWPAGAGAQLNGDPTAVLPLKARPPDVRHAFTSPPAIVHVAPGSPAHSASIAAGSQLLEQARAGATTPVRFEAAGLATPEGRLDAWREWYRSGVRGPVTWTVRDSAGDRPPVVLERPAAWRTGADGWARRHLGMIVQTAVFAGAALLLLLMRSYDLTAGLCVLALTFSAVGGGGPLLGAETGIPVVGRVLTVFAWISSPLAFPSIALAILYFPSRSRLLDRQPWLHAIPLIAALPLVGPALMTGLYLAGLDAARPLALWDATHPWVYYAAFATALGINVLAVGEGAYRYRFNHDANERRRIRMALYTAVPGVLAYAVRDGLPIVASLTGAEPPLFPSWLIVVLDGLVLLPAFGLVYAVGVAHVLGPRVVLRRSLQYALANRSLTVLMFLPSAALVLSLVRERDRNARRDCQRQLGTLPGADHRVGDRVRLPRTGAAVARSALLPRGVRRAQDPAVAGEPGPIRDRPRRPGGDGRQSAGRSAASADDGDPGERHRGQPADAGDRAARQRRTAAGRRRPGVDAAAGPTSRSRSS